jgi:hypothetical protein
VLIAVYEYAFFCLKLAIASLKPQGTRAPYVISASFGERGFESH